MSLFPLVSFVANVFKLYDLRCTYFTCGVKLTRHRVPSAHAYSSVPTVTVERVRGWARSLSVCRKTSACASLDPRRRRGASERSGCRFFPSDGGGEAVRRQKGQLEMGTF